MIDDCSIDKTPEILSKHDIITLRTSSNSGGPNAGRNIGLKALTGDYICIVDHDDIWKENKLQTLLPYLEKAPIISSGYTVLDDSKDSEMVRVKNDPKGSIFYDKNKTFLSALTKTYSGQNTYIGSIIYSSQFKEQLFEEVYGVVDFDWILRLFYQQTSIEVCESLYFRTVSGDNLSLNPSYRMKDYSHSMEFINNYQDEFPQEVELAKKRINGSMARFYYVTDNMSKARSHFKRSEKNLKTLAYYFTTFVGSKFVKKKFNVFG